jgi:serine/threonine protein kinase
VDSDQRLSANLGRQTGTGQMKVCPTCSLTVASDMTICPNDGTVLSGSASPKLISNLAGQYEFIGKIGEGGMGVIYKARHLALNHLVAIKMMHVSQMDQNKILRFQQEAKAVSSLDHPSIVRVRDFGISEAGQPHMVLDFIDGVTLDAMIKTHGPLSLNDAKELFSQICDAVAHAHNRKVLHRDLKPSNVMLVYRDNQPPLPIIVDFGIAKVVDPGQQQGMNLTQTGEIFGSPFYMSPEQTAGKELDQRSDIYSVGCMLFETLTGAPPFVGKNAIETLIMHTSSSPPTLKQGSMGKEFPEALQIVLDKALAKNPQDRFQDMTAFKVALIQAIDHIGSKAGSATEKGKGKSGTGNSAMYVSLILLFLIIAAVTTWMVASRSKSSTDVPEHLQTSTSQGAPPVETANKPSDESGAKSPDVNKASGETSPTNSGAKDPDSLFPDIDVSSMTRIVKNKDSDEISFVWISDAGMAAFDQVTKATRVELDHCSVKGPALSHLAHLHLKSLKIIGDPILSDNWYEFIGNQWDLEDLSLEEAPITDESLNFLNTLGKLQSLSLRKTAITKDGLFRMRGCIHLKELDLRGCQRLKDNDFDLLQPFVNLTVLRLDDTNIKHINAVTKGSTIDLEELDLDSTNFDDESIRNCKPLPKLTSISLERTAVTTQGLTRLASLAPALKKLDIEKCPNLINTDFSFISHYKNLKRLDLGGWRRNDAGMQNLLESNLQRVSFKSCTLENSDLLALAKLKSLRNLALEKNSKLTPDAISQLRRIRPDVKGPIESSDSAAKKELLMAPPPSQ